MDYIIKPIGYLRAKEMVREFHYNSTMPKLTKACLGLFNKSECVGCLTLGWGVRPHHTIDKLFPGLTSKDYYEIGRMCLVEGVCPKNTVSYFLGQTIKWLKRTQPECKLLFTWADAIVGKPGYVYQAANFYYGGFIWTEMYLDAEGTRIHPRTMQGLSTTKGVGKLNSRSFSAVSQLGFTKWFGMQLRYCYPLCSKNEWRELQGNSSVEWQRTTYPKLSDLRWQRQNALGQREHCPMPPFVKGRRVGKDPKQGELFSYD